MTTTLTFLEIIEDNDGVYEFHPLQKCDTRMDGILAAWKSHKDFINTDKGTEFAYGDSMNGREGEFVSSIVNHGLVVTANPDMNYRRIYRLVTIVLSVDTTVAVNA
jgi:hypothetical protein